MEKENNGYNRKGYTWSECALEVEESLMK